MQNISKTNSQANHFGSKAVPSGSNQNSEKKAPIWQLFVQSDKEKNEASTASEILNNK